MPAGIVGHRWGGPRPPLHTLPNINLKREIEITLQQRVCNLEVARMRVARQAARPGAPAPLAAAVPMTMNHHPIGTIHSPFQRATGTPVQPRHAGVYARGTVEILPEFSEGLRDPEYPQGPTPSDFPA